MPATLHFYLCVTSCSLCVP